MSFDAQEEGVLRDVLEELDRERTKRAELEATIRRLSDSVDRAQQENAKLIQEQQQRKDRKQQKQKAEKENHGGKHKSGGSVSRKVFLAMETQVAGYQQLVEALTQGKPAIAAAARAEASSTSSSSPLSQQQRLQHQQQNQQQTLPLHVVRLLEVLPWDPRARAHIFGSENIYEWQIYDTRERKWQSGLKYFPPHPFKALPIVKPKPGVRGSIVEPTETTASTTKENRNLLLFLAGGDKGPAPPSNHGVLTDERTRRVYNIEAGYPLPQDGGSWQWIGGWRIDKHVTVVVTSSGGVMMGSSRHSNNNDANNMMTVGDDSDEDDQQEQKIDCDDQGWSYALEAQHFILNPVGLVYDNPGNGNAPQQPPQRKIRRRKWTRQRILVDYPYASENTQQYLKLLAENARYGVTSTKISDQLVETKMTLTETEEMLVRTKTIQQQEIMQLKEEIKLKNEIFAQTLDKTLTEESLATRTNLISSWSQATAPPVVTPSPPVAAATTTTSTTTQDVGNVGNTAVVLSQTAAAVAAGGGGGVATADGEKNPLHEFLSKNEQVKELGSKFTQWVSRANTKPPGVGGGSDHGVVASSGGDASLMPAGTTTAGHRTSDSMSVSSNDSASKFDWKKIAGRGGLMDKIGGGGGGGIGDTTANSNAKESAAAASSSTTQSLDGGGGGADPTTAAASSVGFVLKEGTGEDDNNS